MTMKAHGAAGLLVLAVACGRAPRAPQTGAATQAPAQGEPRDHGRHHECPRLRRRSDRGRCGGHPRYEDRCSRYEPRPRLHMHGSVRRGRCERRVSLLPGFHDAHAHLSRAGEDRYELFHPWSLDPDDLQAAVTAYARGRAPRQPVDRRARGGARPGSRIGPRAWTSTRSSATGPSCSAITPATTCGPTPRPSLPPGSRGRHARSVRRQDFVRDPSGDPTGVFLDAAQHLVVSREPTVTEQDRAKYVLAGQAMSIEGAWTSMQGGPVTLDEARTYARLDCEGRLVERAFLSAPLLARDEDFQAWIALEKSLPLQTEGSDVVAFKGFADGTLAASTGALLAPYSDDPSTRGPLYIPQDRPDSAGIPRANRAGFPVAIHAVGDRAVRSALDAFARSKRALDHHLVNRVEHATLVDPEDAKRFGMLAGCRLRPQPVWLYGYPSRRSSPTSGLARPHRARLSVGRAGARRGPPPLRGATCRRSHRRSADGHLQRGGAAVPRRRTVHPRAARRRRAGPAGVHYGTRASRIWTGETASARSPLATRPTSCCSTMIPGAARMLAGGPHPPGTVDCRQVDEVAAASSVCLARAMPHCPSEVPSWTETTSSARSRTRLSRSWVGSRKASTRCSARTTARSAARRRPARPRQRGRRQDQGKRREREERARREARQREARHRRPGEGFRRQGTAAGPPVGGPRAHRLSLSSCTRVEVSTSSRAGASRCDASASEESPGTSHASRYESAVGGDAPAGGRLP